MSAERDEVGARIGDVELHVGSSLTRVEDNKRSSLARSQPNLAERYDYSEDVGHCREGDNSRAVGYDAANGIGGENSLIGHGRNSDDRAGCVRHLLPRDEVRVVFQFGDNYFVTGGECETRGITRGRCALHRKRNQVDGLRRVRRENEIVRSSPDKRGDCGAGIVVRLCCFGGQSVGTAVHGGRLGQSKVRFDFDGTARAKSRGRGVEVDKRVSSDVNVEFGELGANSSAFIGGEHRHILSGALTPSRNNPFRKTWPAASLSHKRVRCTSVTGSSPIGVTRQLSYQRW